MSYKDQPFAHRFAALGDEAEAKFEEVWDKPFIRFGINRPPLHVPSLPERIRHMPDYLCSKELVEVKGFGKDQILKVKLVEYNCMNFWNAMHPLVIFAWDSFQKRHGHFSLGQFTQWINEGQAQLAVFPEGKAYIALPAEVIFS